MTVHKAFKKALYSVLLAGWTAKSFAAVDSYRYLHVTVETPWTIFLVLLPFVLAPLVLMAVLAWRYAGKKPESPESNEHGESVGEGARE
jgi:hypothetical protein